MLVQLDHNLLRINRTVSRVCGFFAVSMGSAVFLGYVLNDPDIKSLSGFVTMNPAAALGFVLGGASVLMLGVRAAGHRTVRIAGQAVGVLMFVLGMLKLWGIATGQDVYIDTTLFAEQVHAEGLVRGFPFRIAKFTAGCFALVGAALFLLFRETKEKFAQALLIAVFTTAYTSALWFVYAAQNVTGFAAIAPMSQGTAAAFLALSVGAYLGRPDRGTAAVFSSAGAGGVLLRRLVPIVVLIAIAFSAAARIIQSSEGALYKQGMPILIVAACILVVAIGLIVAGILERTDARRVLATRELQRHRDELEKLVEERTKELRRSNEWFSLASRASRDVIWDKNLAKDTIRYSASFEKTFGYRMPQYDVPGKWFTDAVHPEDRAAVTDSLNWALRTKSAEWSAEYRFRRSDGSYAWVSDRAFVIFGIGREPIRIVGAMTDVSEKRKADEQVRELDQVKNKFIQIVAHQLRTPLNAVRWQLEMLLSGEHGPLKPQQQAIAELAHQADREVIKRIGDLLTAIDIEEDRIVLEKEPFSLEALCASVIGQTKPQCDAKGVSCAFAASKTLPDMIGDSAKIRTALENLIDNALSYTPPNGTIAVKLKHAAGVYRFEVADSGVGIPEAEQHHVFTRFFRASNASRMLPDASGLGLYIARTIIEKHGGRIGFTSKEGKGSTFWVELPRKG